jgi:hypothetical protein
LPHLEPQHVLLQATYYANSDRIEHGMLLHAGGVIQSPNGQYRLRYQVR